MVTVILEQNGQEHTFEFSKITFEELSRFLKFIELKDSAAPETQSKKHKKRHGKFENRRRSNTKKNFSKLGKK